MAERDDLMRAVQAARRGDQLAVAVAALDAHDRRRTASAAQSRELDLSATAVRATLEPLPAFERHTAATDWIGDYEAPSDYRTAMIAEASTWYRSVPREVLADREEFEEQALGHAYTAAGRFGGLALEARKEFMTYVGYLTSQAASGLPQVQQERDPQDNPAPTPLPPETFDNFAPPQNEYNAGVEGLNHDSQISSEQAPGIQQVQQMDGSGSGFGSGPERADEHTTSMDTADSYAEIPLGPPGVIPTTPPGAAPSAPSTPNPMAGAGPQDEGAERRQAVLRVSAFTGPDQDGFRWRIGSADQDVDTFDTPYHERCGSLHWPEQACHRGQEHTASVAVGYLMNAEDFARRAHFEAMGAAEGTAVLRTRDLKKVASHHTALTAAFSAEARTEDEIAWLHGYLARVRPVLAGGKDPFGGKGAKPFGADEDEEPDAFGQGKKKKKKGKGKKTGSRLDFPRAAEAAMRKGAPFAGYKDFAACVAANSDKDDPQAYCGKIKHQVEGAIDPQDRAWSNEPGRSDYDSDNCAYGNHEADGTCAVCDGPVCDEHSVKHDHDRFCPFCAPQPHHQAASQLPQIQQFVDPQGNPDPGGDQLNPAVMFPLTGEGGDEDGKDEGKPGKQAARSSMTPSMHAVRMFGQMDAMDGKAPYHKSNYAFSNQAHGQYIRGYAATRGVLDGYSDRDPMDKNVFHDKTGRGDLHGHYLDAFNEARSRKSGGPQVTGSLSRQADILTKPHESTDDATPPFNSAQTSPDPWSSSEGSGDYDQGVRDGQDDASAGEHPTFSDNSSAVSPYVKGYAVGYSGRPPATGAEDVPRSIGGDSGQAGNAADAQRQFQVSRASLQRTAACIGCGHLPHLGQPCTEKYCTDKHAEGEMGSGSGTTKIPPSMEKDPGSYRVRPKTMWQEGSVRRQADYQRPYEQDSYDYVDPSVRSAIPQHVMHDLWRRDPDAGDTQPTDDDYARFRDYVRRTHGQGVHDAYFGRQGMRRVSAAFVTRAAGSDPDFAKGYKYAARWKPGIRLVAMGSPAFEAGMYAAIADRPGGIQARWVVTHQKLSARHSMLARRLDAHAGFTRKLILAGRGRYQPSATGCYPVRRQAATSVDLITDGPGASPDPMGNTPLNGPGNPPPMGGGEDPARSGGPSPYQGAPPPASAPVVPDDVMGQPQEPPQPGGPFTQTFSGRHPENADLAPVAPNTAAGPGYQNRDAYQGDPMHKPQTAAFRQRVQASLASRRAG